MSSIEDILNAEDSEEEVDLSAVIDVEYLLHSNDEYDDNPMCGDGAQRINADAPPSLAQTRVVELSSHRGKMEAVTVEDLHDSATDEIVDVELNSKKDATTSHVGGLQDADAREQSFLSAGRWESLSALQSKRSSASLLNHSNVKCNELAKVSDQLRRNSTYKQHGPGVATAMIVTGNFMAVGTAKGLIILFDHSEEIRQVLGSNLPAGVRPTAPITALDAPKFITGCAVRGVEGLLVCGYASGEVALWDVAKGAVLKLINDLHKSSISTVSVLETVSDGFASLGGAGVEHLLALPASWRSGGSGRAAAPAADFSSFMSSTASASAGLSGVSLVVISSDKDGVMYKTRLSKTLWSSSYSAEPECLLDASTGPLSGVATLGPLLNAIGIDAGTTIAGDNVLSCKYLVAHRNTRLMAINVGSAQTWVVQTHPKIKIVHKWDAPFGTETNCRELAWTWAQVASSQGADESPPDWHPLLARCWGEELQTLALLTTLTVNAASKVKASAASSDVASAFGGAFSSLLARPTGSVAEPDVRAYASKFSPGHRRSFPGQKVLALRWITPRELVILTVSDVIVTSSQLQCMEQLSLAPSVSMDLSLHYNRALELASSFEAGPPQEQPLKLHCDVIDGKLFVVVHENALQVHTESCFELAERLIGRAQWLEALALIIENIRKTAPAPAWLDAEVDRYIVRYAELAVKHAVGPGPAAFGMDGAAQQSRSNHFHLVAGVCIEYCVACARVDVLFARVYHVFRSAQQHHAFLEALEPFVLSRGVVSLPPNVIADFCEYALRSHKLPSIERCVAYFEIAHLDMHFMTKFLFENRMYSGFLYVCSNGLNDFPAAFQVVFSFMLPSWERDGGGCEESVCVAEIGYKLLLFLSYSFEGRVFPRGDRFEPSLSVHTVALSLLSIVTEPTLRPMPAIFSSLAPAAASAKLSALVGPHPYLARLAAVDRAGLMTVLRSGVEGLLLSSTAIPFCSDEPKQDEAKEVAGVLDKIRHFCESLQDNADRSKALEGFYDEFMPVIAHCPYKLNDEFLQAVVAHAGTTKIASERDGLEAYLTELMERQARVAGHVLSSKLRQSMESQNFWIASLAAARCSSTVEKEEILQEQRLSTAIQHYGELHHERDSSIPAVFRYLELVFSVLDTVFPVSHRQNHEITFCRELVAALPVLGRIDVSLTKQLVHSRLVAHVPGIITSTAHDPRLRYEMLDALVAQQDEVMATRQNQLKESFSTEDLLVYVADLATFEPVKIVTFLRSFEAQYPHDECLQICRQKGLSEAVAFLMERAGEVLDALLMLLKDFSTRLKQVRRDVDAQLRAELAAQAAAAKANIRVAPLDCEHHVVSTILSKQDAEREQAARRLSGYNVLLGIINCVADLCARNSKEDRAGMWLMAFDHLLMERLAVRAGTVSSSGEVVVVLIGLMLQALLEHMSHAAAQVTPQQVIRRVTAQGNAAGIRLGEFKGMMLSMLGANHQEKQLHSSMVRIIRADLAVLQRQKITKLRKYCCRGDDAVRTHSGEDWAPGPGDEETNAEAPLKLVKAGRRVTRNYQQIFAESALPPDASAVLLLSTGVPAMDVAAVEVRRSGSLNRTAMYRSSM